MTDPVLTFAFELRAQIGPPQEIGEVRGGRRRIGERLMRPSAVRSGRTAPAACGSGRPCVGPQGQRRHPGTVRS